MNNRINGDNRLIMEKHYGHDGKFNMEVKFTVDGSNTEVMEANEGIAILIDNEKIVTTGCITLKGTLNSMIHIMRIFINHFRNHGGNYKEELYEYGLMMLDSLAGMLYEEIEGDNNESGMDDLN